MKTIIGLFDDRAQAQSAAASLEAAGIAHNDISFIANNADRSYGTVDETTPPEDRMIQATITDAEWGAGIGGALGLLAGASLFVIPGLGWIAGAGWLAGMLGGAAVGGAIGGIVGILANIGVPAEDAAYYSEGVRRGGNLLAVRAQDHDSDRVSRILDNNGAVDIDERGSQYRQEGFVPTYNNAPSPLASSSPTLVDTATRTRGYNYAEPQPIVNNGIPGVQTGGRANDGTPDTRGITEKVADAVTGDYIDDKTGKPVLHPDNGVKPIVDNGIPGIQTGGHATDGTPDTRGITEKAADALTGDRFDDKTGKVVR